MYPREKLTQNQPQELRVDVLTHKPPRRHSHNPSSLYAKRAKAKISSKSTDIVFVNTVYEHGEQALRRPSQLPPPPTSVVREQYWACSKWSDTQRYLTIAVAVLFGTVVGLVVVVIIRGGDPEDFIGGIFRIQPPSPE